MAERASQKVSPCLEGSLTVRKSFDSGEKVNGPRHIVPAVLCVSFFLVDLQAMALVNILYLRGLLVPR